MGTSADGHTLLCQLVFQGKTEKALPSNMKYKKSTVAPSAGGKKKEREEAADTGKSSKMSASFVPDFVNTDHSSKFRGLGSLAVTHDHWSDIHTSKSWVQDILVQYYVSTCGRLQLVAGTQKCILLIDCWWGWLDAEFQQWLKKEHPYILYMYLPAALQLLSQMTQASLLF